MKKVSSRSLNIRRLDVTLQVAKVEKHNLPHCTYAIMNIILSPEGNPFFSFTETNNEISLIMEEKLLQTFPHDKLEVGPKKFKALEITGPLGVSSVGIVHSVTQPLAQAGISIFYISTYQTDYTLIPEEEVDHALSILSKQFSIKLSNPGKNLKLLPSEPKSNGTQKQEEISVKKHSLAMNNNALYLASIDKDDPFLVGSYILQLMFLSEKDDKWFFSYSETSGEVSLIFSSKEMEIMKAIKGDDLRCYSSDFTRLFVNDGPLGFDEYGIVESISNPLASSNVSLFYIGTFSTDHFLVTSTEIQLALDSLNLYGFSVAKDETQ